MLIDDGNGTRIRTVQSAPFSSPSSVALRGAGESLINQIDRLVAARIDDKLLRSGARMPSIRQFAAMPVLADPVGVHARTP